MRWKFNMLSEYGNLSSTLIIVPIFLIIVHMSLLLTFLFGLHVSKSVK